MLIVVAHFWQSLCNLHKICIPCVFTATNHFCTEQIEWDRKSCIETTQETNWFKKTKLTVTPNPGLTLPSQTIMMNCARSQQDGRFGTVKNGKALIETQPKAPVTNTELRLIWHHLIKLNMLHLTVKYGEFLLWSFCSKILHHYLIPTWAFANFKLIFLFATLGFKDASVLLSNPYGSFKQQ